MRLEIISAEKTIFGGEVELVTLPGTKGSFTVLHNHASLVSTLEKGTIEYVIGNERHTLEVSGGFVDVDNNRIAVCIY
ncbi:MAG: ATP synthase F1 subunit epsilon [Bacteroidaceae bacterium]|jgi:F-type H+-transporting ATPase subunit epsilon|nr:ATP synthase F1 subunit epsilon [Bacteroidaceae bacterium]